MMILLTEQSVLLELSELMRLKTAGLLRIPMDKVGVTWSLGGIAGIAGSVASKIGASSHIKGGMLPKVHVERCPELEGIPDDKIQQVIGVIVDKLRMDAAIRLEGIHQRRAHGG
jgi:hypothetical protein